MPKLEPLEKLLKRMPKHMTFDWTQIQNLSDLQFQVAHELDMAEENEIKLTKTQLHKLKMFYADIGIAMQKDAGIQ